MDLLNQTTQLSEEQTAASDKAYDEAAHALSNVEGLKLPNILPDELKNQSNKIKEESKTALQNSQEKVAENKGLLEEAQRVLNEAREEIRNAKAQQVEADRLLNDVKGAHSRAQDAFELATNTWNEAKDSLDILSDFKNNVDASKEQALKELEQLPQIEKDIQIAEDTTKETEDAIGDAKNNADSALNIAKNAQEEAELVKKKAEQLIEDLANTKKRYDENQGTVDKVTNSINTISNTTKDFENQAISDSDKTQEVLRKATVAETNAIGLQEKLTESEKLLNAAWDQLNSLDDVNDDQLEELNNLLEETEKGYETAALERQIKAEKDRRAEQEKSYLKKEIDVLQRELQNLQSIYAALPTKCFNVINLEQEGQK
uniref:Uncharacterized protein n=1 Tax=Acrobeloides nanus TaxID=290746 RepID=A0A914CX17_9BILA